MYSSSTKCQSHPAARFSARSSVTGRLKMRRISTKPLSRQSCSVKLSVLRCGWRCLAALECKPQPPSQTPATIVCFMPSLTSLEATGSVASDTWRWSFCGENVVDILHTSLHPANLRTARLWAANSHEDHRTRRHQKSDPSSAIEQSSSASTC